MGIGCRVWEVFGIDVWGVNKIGLDIWKNEVIFGCCG